MMQKTHYCLVLRGFPQRYRNCMAGAENCMTAFITSFSPSTDSRKMFLKQEDDRETSTGSDVGCFLSE